MSNSIHKLVADVTDQTSFLIFTRALLDDRLDASNKEELNSAPPYGPDAGGWENTTIETFLEAAISWSEDSQFGDQVPGISVENNPWRKFAYFLLAGSRYE